ncbi:hypothetical protein [Candidatus Arthromitus sp. SFB-rat-Yit]|uniref:hypothetical protein n=1 Tax=Candidatus Arthromitus sp. SFB-rat-Yit TaxID=1041504 RepID=UPI0002EBFCA8|nr:hypothetical protein [Candidatus Arthromitus sp. SFB-rat-Yit]
MDNKNSDYKKLNIDNIFNYCNHNNIDVQLFLNFENKYTTDKVGYGNITLNVLN